MQSWLEIGPVVDKIFKFRFFVSISSWKRVRCDLLLEQTRIPINQGCFVSSLVDISPVVLEKKKFNFVNFFSLLRNYLLLEKDVALLLNKLESLSLKDDLFVWNWRCGSGQQRRRRTRKEHPSHQLRWAKKRVFSLSWAESKSISIFFSRITEPISAKLLGEGFQFS